MESPKRPVPEMEAPVSLTASDGTGLQVVSLQARAVIQEPLAFTELHLTFRNPAPHQIEGRFQITLPPGATISRFAMRQSSGWQEGEVVELQAARVAYEDFLHRRQDPALLEKQAGNQFQARVFPIPPSADKEIILSYSQELARSEQPYRLLLRGLPLLEQLDIKVFLARRKVGAAHTNLGGTILSTEVVEVHQQHFAPDRDFEAPLQPKEGDGPIGLRNDNLVAARVVPIKDAPAARIESLLVLLDSSASRALGFAAQVARLGAVLQQVQKVAGDKIPLQIVCFDQEVAKMYAGPLGSFGAEAQNAIRERRALGASDLSKALRYVAAQKDARFARVLLISDGIATAGETEATALRKLARGLADAGVQRLDALIAGGIRDDALLHQLVTAGLPRDGVVLDEDQAPAVVAQRLASASFSGLAVQVPGSSWVWPLHVDGVQPGDPVVVYADLPPNQPFSVVISGAAASRHLVSPALVERPLLERAWVHARIRRLMYQRDTLGEHDTDLRDALKHQIIDLSTRFRVLCDLTALLVLETEQDYARFRIDRRALSDILTVGASGLEVLNRRSSSPLPLQFDPPPPRAMELAEPPQVTLPKLPGPGVAAPPAPPEPAKPPATTAPGNVPSGNGDTDHDGIPDAADRCPYEPGPAAENGCPPPRRYIMVTREKIELSEKIMFASRQATLRPISFDLLNEVISVMRSRVGNCLLIEGHTDARSEGTLDNMMRLSQKRAEVVKQYLVAHGIPAEQLITEGYGPTRPVCTEATAACRDKNRRAEFVNVGGMKCQTPTSGHTAPAENVATWRPPAATPPARDVQPANDEFRDGFSRDFDGENNKPRHVAYTGRFLQIMKLIEKHEAGQALQIAMRWRDQEPGDVVALIGLGEALEALGQKERAARVYGSLIDLFPARADLRRAAGTRLERLKTVAQDLAIDTFQKARTQRPDHPASHRLLAYALLRAGQPAAAFAAVVEGLQQQYPPGRFRGVDEILKEDAGLIAAVWIAREPQQRESLLVRLKELGSALATERSLRMVMNWETDANDVDLHVWDAQKNHASYNHFSMASGGFLYSDVTDGYGPECFSIFGRPRAYPYRLGIHYYSRGPMGYGMGKIEIIEHDGKGHLAFDERPFLIMVDEGFVYLGEVKGPLLP